MYTPRDYQTESIGKALEFFHGTRRNPTFHVLPTGSGKSICIAGVTKELEGQTVVLQPNREILTQNYEKYTSYGNMAGIYSDSLKLKYIDKVTFATIGSVINKKHLFKNLRNIIIDECFPAGTMVDNKPIQEIREGDHVKSFNHKKNCIEYKKVVRLFKKVFTGDMVKINLSNGRFIVCTDNHPIYTKEFGYIPAKMLTLCLDNTINLIQGSLYEKDNKTLCRVQHRVQEEGTRFYKQNILLQRMQEISSGENKNEGAYTVFSLRNETCSNRDTKNSICRYRESILLKGVFRTYKSKGAYFCWSGNKKHKGVQRGGFKKDEGTKSNVDSGCKRKNDRILEGENISESWGKWSVDKTANDATLSHCISNGVPDRNKGGEALIRVSSQLLQSRLSMGREENSNRSRWSIAPIKEVEVPRPTKDGDFKFIRMESAEIYEPRDRQESKKVCEDYYVYNIEVEDNHNYFVENILVHNCDLVQFNSGQYHTFIQSFPKARTWGLTATPYRLEADRSGASLVFLNYPYRKLFHTMDYFVQNDVLFDRGYLCPLEYIDYSVIDRRKLDINENGSAFTESSIRAFNRAIDLPSITARHANELLEQRENLLGFCSLVSEAELTAKKVPGSVVIHAETDPKLRTKIVKDFKSGEIRAVFNVGVLLCGFDHPRLETILDASATMSLRRYYQKNGRGVRTHKDKKDCWLVGLAGNHEFFGDIESMRIRKNYKGDYAVWNGSKQLTGVSFTK